MHEKEVRIKWITFKAHCHLTPHTEVLRQTEGRRLPLANVGNARFIMSVANSKITVISLNPVVLRAVSDECGILHRSCDLPAKLQLLSTGANFCFYMTRCKSLRMKL